ncbi:MAG: LysR family transcriptional regulator [Prevotella sp.]|nr:LysR family transcriptional regulator [Prevotella sp.]
MELRQLKYFVGIAETGRFSDASKQLFISQSAVSQQIKLLEEELGTQLFVRNQHSVSLTESGKELLPLARKVLRGITDCYDRIADLKGMLCGELNIGLTYTLEPYVREAMLSFMKTYPKVQVNAYYKNLPELLARLRNCEIDMMLSMMPTSPHEFIDSVPLMEYRLSAIMRKTHPLAGKKQLTFHDLEHQGLILPEKGIRDRNAIESYIHTETGTLNIRSLVNDANAILNILQESNYISILAENTIANRPSLCAVPIVALDKPITVYAHFNREISRKHSADVFLEKFRGTSAYFVAKNKM